MITPCRLDSVLHAPLPPPEQRRKGGKPQVVGKRLPSLETVLADPTTVWQESIMPWYGQGKRRVQWCTGTAWWYRFGHPPLPIRWVITRDPDGKRPVKALLCTDPTFGAQQIIRTFMLRWTIETPLRRAVPSWASKRSDSGPTWPLNAPLLLAVYSLVVLKEADG